MKNSINSDEPKINRKVKDSVFTSLFSDKNNLLKLYKTLHPEDTAATVESITNVTLENVLTNDLYNDLGFLIEDKLIILAESQSTWSANILIRALFYLSKSYQKYFDDKGVNLFSTHKAKMPKPEIYVIYTGERGEKPSQLLLSKDFFGCEVCDLELKANIIYENDSDDIINQYIIFCKVINEQIKIHGLTKKATEQAIRICADRDVLKEFLEKHKSEVVTMYDFLFDQEEITRRYLQEEIQMGIQQGLQQIKQQGIQQGIQMGAHDAEIETAKRMLKMGKFSCEDIAASIGLNINEIEKLKNEINM